MIDKWAIKRIGALVALIVGWVEFALISLTWRKSGLAGQTAAS